MDSVPPRRRLKLKHFAAIAVSVVVLAAIFVPFQHVEAFSLGVTIPSTVTRTPAGADFSLTLYVQPGELISFETVTILLDGGPSQQVCTFDDSGAPVGECDLIDSLTITVSPDKPKTPGYAFGYGHVSSGPVGSGEPVTIGNIGNNYYSYVYSYGLTSYVNGYVGPVTITFSGNLHTGSLDVGTHTIQASIDTGASNTNSHLVSDVQEFEVEGGGTGTVTGHKFNDMNGNGVWETATEGGISGIEICVFSYETFAESCITTDGSGAYTLTDIPAGNIAVSEHDLPGGYTATVPYGGSSYTHLDAGETLTVDFGNHRRGAIIGNGQVIVGVDDLGQLNIPYREVPALGLPPTDPAHVGSVGLRDATGHFTATEQGCVCEGWGVGAGTSSGEFAGYANNAEGTANAHLESFTGVDGGTTAESVVIINDNHGDPALRVTHNFEPSNITPHLYNVTVTVENISPVTVDNVVYRRSMDWDIDPTRFNEYVTIQGTATTPLLIRSGNNGFISDDIVNYHDPSDFVIFPGTESTVFKKDFVDLGPADHGAAFDFALGDLPSGDAVTMLIFYGNAHDESVAVSSVTSQGVELYSLGQSTLPGPHPDNTGIQGPTSMFGFGGVGGAAISPELDINIIKFRDTNTDGVQNLGEEPLSGFTFDIRDATNALLGSVTTGPSGTASFHIASTATTPFPYTVTEQDKPGWGATTSTTQTVTAFGSPSKTVRFGNVPTTTISGMKYNDTNSNGVRNPGELGMSGVTMTLKAYDVHTGSLSTWATTSTGPDGSYEFDGVRVGGFYQVVEGGLSNHIQISPSYGLPQMIHVTGSGPVTGIDFGNARINPGTLELFKYVDSDHDNSPDPGEGISGANFVVYSFSGFPTTTITSGGSGLATHEFPPGDYYVYELHTPGSPMIPVGPSYQFIHLTPGGTVHTDFKNKVLIHMPGDITVPSGTDYDDDDIPEVRRGGTVILNKDLSGVFSEFEKTHGDISSIKLDIQLDDGSTRTTSMTRIGATDSYTGTIPGPFAGSSLRAIVSIDFLPAGSGPEDVQEIGDILLIDPSGKVFDRLTGDPIEGATVTITRDVGAELFVPVDETDGTILPATNPLVTGPDGAYSWNVAPGNYRVESSAAQHEDYVTSTLPVPPAQTGVDLYMTKIGDTFTYNVATGASEVNVGASISATATTNDKAAKVVVFEWFNAAHNLVRTASKTVSGGVASDSVVPSSNGDWTVTATFMLRVSNEITALEEIDDASDVFTVNSAGGGGHRGGGGGGGGIGGSITFPDSYFDLNPLLKILIQSTTFLNAQGQGIFQAHVGEQIEISNLFTNYQQHSQNYAFIVEVTDENGVVTDLGWQNGDAPSGKTVSVSRSWTPQATGVYTVRILVWDDVSDAPIPLSDITVKVIRVTE